MPTVVVVVSGIDAHPSLFAAIGAVCYAGWYAYFGEASLAITVIKHAGGRIVGDVEIEATVQVVVQPHDAEAVVGVGINIQFFAHVGEGAVAIVVIQAVASALQSAWPAGDWNSAILTKRPLPKFRQVIEIEVHVVRHVKIEIAVVVVIAESGAGPPMPQIADTRFSRYICECAVVVVVIQHGAIEISYIEIFPAVVVIVAYGRAKSPATMGKPRLGGHIGEGAVVIVTVQLAGMAFARLQIFDRGTVHE